MDFLSKQWKQNQVLFKFFPFDVSDLNQTGLYMTQTCYLIFKLIIVGAWAIVFGWQVRYWKLKILLFLSTWNLLIGIFYQIFSLSEILFNKKLKKYKIWRINHFLFASLLVVSIVVLVFDSSLINRSFLQYTDNQTVASMLFYSSCLVPTVLTLIEFAINNVLITNYRCMMIYAIYGGPYTLTLSIYTLRTFLLNSVVEPVYKQITFKDSRSYLILFSTVIITGMAFMLIRIYCQIVKIRKTIMFMMDIATKQLGIDDSVTSADHQFQRKPRSLAEYANMAKLKKPIPVRETRLKKMLPSLQKVFTSIINYQE